MNGFGGFLAGAIVGKMILDRTQWQQSVDKVKSDEKTLAGSASRIGNKFAGIGKAMTIAGGAIVGTLGMMVKNYVKAGDEVHKMALRTGFATETLSELRYAAQISGTDLTSLEKAVKKMQKTIVDASEGMTTYQRAFERIGVNYKELQGLHPEQQFEILAKAIAAIEDPTIRAATAQDLFGRAGTKLLPLFAQGVDGMEALREKARELGMVFDQEAADKAARLADAQATLKGAMQGLTIAIAENIVPVLSKFVEGLSGVISKISDWMRANPFLASTITKVVSVLGGLMAVFGPMLLLLPKLAASFTLVKTAMLAVTGPVGIAVAAITGLITIGTLVYKNWDKISKFLVSIWHGISDKAVEIFGKIKEFIIDSLYWLVEKISKVPLAGKFVKPWKEALAEARREMVSTETVVSEKSLEMAQAFIGAVKKTDIYKKAVGFLGDKVKALGSIFSGAKGKTDELSTGIQNLGIETDIAKKKQQTWVEYLKDMGIKTIAEKQNRIEELERVLEDLHEAYRNGEIDLDAYTKAVKSVKDEISDLLVVTETAIPQSRNLSDTIASAVPKMQSMTFATLSAKEQLITFANQAGITTEQVQKNFYYLSKSVMDLAGIHMPNLILSNKAAWPQIRDEAEKTDNTFTQVSQRIKDAWTWGLKDMLSGAKSFKDVMKGIWGTIKEQFFTLVAQMISKWTIGFIDKLISGGEGLLGNIKSIFSDVGDFISGIFGKTKDAVGGAAQAASSAASGVVDAAKGMSKGFLSNIASIAGPVGIGLLVGKMIGFKNISKTVQDAWKAASEVVIGSIKNIGKVSDAVFGAISDIVGGIGKAVGGLLSGIGGLLGGAGKKASDVTYWLKIIWENSQNILNQLVGFFHAKILHMIDQFRDVKRNTLLTSRFAEGARDRLKSIDAEIKALPSRLKIISKSIVDGLNSILSALTSKGTIYVNMTASKVIDSMTATLSNSISTVGKAEAIKKQLSTLELQLAAKLKDLQAKLVTATGDEKNALLKQMAMLEVQAQKKRQQLIDRLHDVQKATRESAVTIREGVGRALKPMFQPVADAIRGLRGKMISAQHGAVITEPQLVMTHGTPSAPEYVLPSSALNRLLTMTSLSPVFHNTVNIYAQKLDDRTIDEAAQKIFAAIDWQARRRGYRL